MSAAPFLPDVCACGRDATPGRRACARCRCVALGARLSPADRFDHLGDAAAVLVERSLLEGEAALLRARALAAVEAGAPAVEWASREGGTVRTFAASPQPERTDPAPLHIPTVEVRRG